MSDAGYTLTETLAAMVVIGLGVGGFSLGMQTLGAQQGVVGGVVLKTQDTRAAEAWLERRLSEHAPYRATDGDRFSGDAEGFRFDCGAAQRCSAELVTNEGRQTLRLSRGDGGQQTFQLPAREPARLVYFGAVAAQAAWPPAGGERESLRAISLLQGVGPDQRPVLAVRLRPEQPLDCQYDPVIKDCR